MLIEFLGLSTKLESVICSLVNTSNFSHLFHWLRAGLDCAVGTDDVVNTFDVKNGVVEFDCR